jgi:hypothetical protein
MNDRAVPRACHCFCVTGHPETALFRRCISAPEPGLFIVLYAALAGHTPVPVCRYCYLGRTQRQKS